MVQPRRKTVMLTLTHECNLACRYCYESNKSDATMSLPIAEAALERHFAKLDSSDEIEISLHGGEPFLCFDRIRALCEWTWARDWPKPYIFFITTNGTLVHGEVQNWAAAHRDRVYLSLSLDGTPAMHNANRSNSHSLIDTGFFRRTWPEQPIKMTVSDVTLTHLAQGLMYLHGLGFQVQCNLAYGVDWTRHENTAVLAEQLDQLIEYYLNNPNIRPCDLLAMKLSVVGMASTEGRKLTGIAGQELKKWCGIGTDLVAVDVDGQDYPCHLFLPLSAGEKIGMHRRFDFTDCKTLQDNRCKQCVLLPICPTCYGINALQCGDPAVRDQALCKLTQVRSLACSSLLARMMGRRGDFSTTRDMDAREAMFSILGIQSVQDSISAIDGTGTIIHPPASGPLTSDL